MSAKDVIWVFRRAAMIEFLSRFETHLFDTTVWSNRHERLVMLHPVGSQADQDIE
jgi:hypothetical protein